MYHQLKLATVIINHKIGLYRIAVLPGMMCLASAMRTLYRRLFRYGLGEIGK
jgi:hypothetical protein